LASGIQHSPILREERDRAFVLGQPTVRRSLSGISEPISWNAGRSSGPAPSTTVRGSHFLQLLEQVRYRCLASRPLSNGARLLATVHVSRPIERTGRYRRVDEI